MPSLGNALAGSAWLHAPDESVNAVAAWLVVPAIELIEIVTVRPEAVPPSL
jgi:hypothetical protein